MASAAARTRLTPKEYITFERKASFKNEFIKGEIVAMSGASRSHNRITGDVFNGISNQLVDSECEAFIGDMRVKAGTTASYFYPDVVVACKELRFEDDVFDTLLNPRVVVEVLSPSTEADDRGEKFARYRQLASLQEYILISQDKVRVEHYLRQGTQWISTEFRKLTDVLPLTSINCTLPLRDIYRRVTF